MELMWDSDFKGHIKNFVRILDELQGVLLALTDFLTQSCKPAKYAAAIPSFEEIFCHFDPAMAFTLIRSALPAYVPGGRRGGNQ